MTTPPFERYAGREQAWVKHYFLGNYLERLIHKVAASFDTIVYVDGFSGPWKSEADDFADTSFGIALEALRKAKGAWQAHRREVQMKAVLVEERAKAFAALQQLQPKYPDVEITPLRGDFRELIDTIMAAIPSSGFAFFLIDPKGWRIPMAKLDRLVSRPNSEVLFNFMFEFINRAAAMSAPVTFEGLNELLPVDGWRDALAEIDRNSPPEAVADARKKVLHEAFRRVLRERGHYPYVADVPVLRPLKERQIYSLVYATRSDTGIEVFRDCQIKTLGEQDAMRGAAQVAAQKAASGQGDMFGTNAGMAPSMTDDFLASERTAAEAMLIECAHGEGLLWGKAWPAVLSRHAIRRTELNAIAARLRKDGVLAFEGWTDRKRVPDDHYRMRLAEG